MPRKIETHKSNECNRRIEVLAHGKPGTGGAPIHYEMQIPPQGPENIGQVVHLHFQNGTIAEAGVNGWTHEALLAILIDRLEAFQAGPFAGPENENALHNLRAALRQLNQRTAAREARGVEGTLEP